jgi:hypothetical protein
MMMLRRGNGAELDDICGVCLRAVENSILRPAGGENGKRMCFIQFCHRFYSVAKPGKTPSYRERRPEKTGFICVPQHSWRLRDYFQARFLFWQATG